MTAPIWHAPKQEVHKGSARDADPPWASFDVVLRRDYDALLAERQQLQEERDAAFDAAGLPRTASLDDLIRHHRNNAGMASSGHKIAAEEWEKRAVKAEAERQQAQEERDAAHEHTRAYHNHCRARIDGRHEWVYVGAGKYRCAGCGAE